MSAPEQVVRFGVLAADDVAIGFQGTGAERTRATVERALEALIANGIITVVPEGEWPMFFAPFPPYRSPL